MNYTQEQKLVIDLRDKNILVSAAAGSGKTAVLKERILSLVTDKERDIDVDRILVLTYTNAAAGEMRERIDKAITTALNENPSDENLQRQKLLIQNAQISTIHSFCLFVLKNNFAEIGIDPGFRNMDEGERKLLLKELLTDILESYYEEGEDTFINLVECYASGISEGSLEETILDMHNFLLSLAMPEKWLKEAREDFAVNSVSEFEEKKWWKEGILPVADSIIDECLELSKKGLEISKLPDGPEKSIDGFTDYKRIFTELKDEKSYQKRYEIISGATVSKFNDTKKADDSLKEQARTIKEYIKKCFDELSKKIYLAKASVFISDSQIMEKTACKLLEITEKLYTRFNELKREKNLIDFSDMEHLTLKILVDEDGNRTQAAEDYRDYFAAVMVDEYQDINQVQETILKSIVKDNNYFMVGDVKQSIYRFREAKPDIFIGKYNTFSKDDINVKIELNNNFRSRKEVLTFVNQIFTLAMKRKTSKIEYDEAASLKAGALCYTEDADISYKPEILIAQSADDEAVKKFGIGNNSRCTEAMLVANKIDELVSSKMKIYDSDKDIYRPVSYKDIVILMFSVNKSGDIYKAALDSKNIPYIAENKSGYFKTSEVKTVLNMLEIINNPTSDVELYGCLTDYFGGFTVEEIGKVRADNKDKTLYESVISYIENEDADNNLAGRLKAFLDSVNEYRFLTTYMGTREILDKLVISTGYIDYILAKKGGIQKKANVLLLLEKASDYEKTSYHGLFRFVRYIKNLKERNTDFGEAVTLDENEDAVRIMTIHKSKGLEYPVCFLCAADADYLDMDSKKSVALNADYGFALDVVNPEKRYKRKSLKKNIITRRVVYDNFAEQLRVLYVALTRAREKLYITGTVSLLSEDKKKDRSLQEAFELRLVPEGCFFDMSILFYRNYLSIIANAISSLGLNAVYFKYYTASAVEASVKEEELKLGLTKEMLTDDSIKPDSEYYKSINDILNYQYKFSYLKGLKNKVSVSDIKKNAIHEMNEDDDGALVQEPDIPVIGLNPESLLLDNLKTDSVLYQSVMDDELSDEADKYIPSFIRDDAKDLDQNHYNNTENTKVEKSLIGTVCHRLMELIDYKSVKTDSDGMVSYEAAVKAIDDAIAINEKNGKLSPEYVQLIKNGGGTGFITYEKAKKFFNTRLARDMIKADREGKLFREKSFFMGIPFKKANPNYPEDDDVLVQGIIDVYFENENGDIVLADYKTDSLKNIAINGGYGNDKLKKAETIEDKLNALVLRYKVQLDLYGEAIERISGKKVVDKVIYSFDADKEIFF